MECHKCEIERKMKIDQGKVWFVPLEHCDSCNQPERSKREDNIESENWNEVHLKNLDEATQGRFGTCPIRFDIDAVL